MYKFDQPNQQSELWVGNSTEFSELYVEEGILGVGWVAEQDKVLFLNKEGTGPFSIL